MLIRKVRQLGGPLITGIAINAFESKYANLFTPELSGIALHLVSDLTRDDDKMHINAATVGRSDEGCVVGYFYTSVPMKNDGPVDFVALRRDLVRPKTIELCCEIMRFENANQEFKNDQLDVIKKVAGEIYHYIMSSDKVLSNDFFSDD